MTNDRVLGLALIGGGALLGWWLVRTPEKQDPGAVTAHAYGFGVTQYPATMRPGQGVTEPPSIAG